MLRSLMTAVTGVRAHQTMLDVTGNNIANVNTTGFKKDFTVFQDILYQTTQGATGPGDARGGIDPAQIGLGVKVAAIETLHTQGPINYTGNPTDMAIQGEGYFVFRDGGSRIYSRAGNFIRDAENNLVHSGTGYYVQGYKMERDPLNPMNFIKSSELSDVNIPIGAKMEARATTVVGFRCNLDSRSESYLPIGYADIPFTNQNNDANVTIGETSYNVGFNTDLGSPDGTGYLTIRISSGSGAGSTVVFDMIGINNGYPVLSATNANNEIILPDGTVASIFYDNDTGVFKLIDATPGSQTIGSTLWRTNFHENMSYTSFSVKDSQAYMSGTAASYDFLAEFDEGDLSNSPVPLTLWWNDAGTMQPVKFNVNMNPDGTFDSISQASGTLPPGYVFGDNFDIVLAANGSALEIKATKDSSAPGAALETVGQINQGGMRQTKQTIYDCQGNPYTLEVTFKKLTENRWRWEASFPDNEQLFATPASGEITFGECGKIVDPPFVNIEVPYSLLGTKNETVKLDFSGESFGLDVMEGVTQYASESTTKPYYQDGYTMGVLKDFTIGKDGTIVGVYTNNQNIPIYRLALAQFANPMGLEKAGDTMFRETVNSGLARIDAAMVDGAGTIAGGYLEASNVDLTEEFTRLILAQRGFQANTRVVTTSDQILEEVVNMKR